MEKWGSWQVFMIGIGFLFILLSPSMPNQWPFIIGGLMIILLGIIIFKRSARKERRKNGKW